MDETRGPIPPVSRFSESDYCYGSGPLTIRLERVDWARPVRYDGENWYEVDGIEVAFDGRDIGRRRALIRGRCLSALPRNKPS